MPAARLEAGGDGQAGYGVADHLALTAAEAADGITHKKDLGEVLGAQGGAAKALAGAELTLNGNAVVGIEAEVRSAVRSVRSFFARACGLEFVVEFHI